MANDAETKLMATESEAPLCQALSSKRSPDDQMVIEDGPNCCAKCSRSGMHYIMFD